MRNEAGIIGCILIDNKSFDLVYKSCLPEMFSNSLLKDTFIESRKMYDLGIQISPVSLIQPLMSLSHKEEDIRKTLFACAREVSTSNEIVNYAKNLENRYKSEQLKEFVKKISYKPCDAEKSLKEMLTFAESMGSKTKQKAKSFSQIVSDNKDSYFTDKPIGLKLGFPKLDEMIGGIEKGDVVVIGARTSVGKSAFSTQIIKNLALQGKKVGYFNLEMSEAQIYERILASESGVKLTRVRKAISQLEQDGINERVAIPEANERLKKLNNLIVYSGSYSVNEIRNDARHQEFDLIVIDYLQLIKSDKSYSNRVSEVGYISKTIKEMAMELKVPVIALSQLNRRTEEVKEPEMTELRESGDIEQDASTIILMWNMTDDRTFKGVKVEKNRQGEYGKVGMDFDGAHMKFTENMERFEELKKTKDRGFERATYSPF